MKDSGELRHTFNQEAELYNKIRPLYPKALYDKLIETAQLSKEAKLLEVGPGTGQATRPLAERGYHITAVELGAELAEVARRELKQYPKVQVITGAFEEVELQENGFDLVYAATAFHWIKPEARYVKPHRLLKSNGHLGVIHTNHVSDEQGDKFFQATQPIYDKYFPPKGDEKFKLPLSVELKPTELDEKLFKLVLFECFPITYKYSTEEYVQLLATYSPNLALPVDKRQRFFDEIKGLINQNFGGVILKPFTMTLTLAKKV